MDLKQLANLQSVNFLDAVHVNDNGYLGTEYPLGTPEWPVLTLAQARIVSAARLMTTLVLHGAFTLDAAMEHYSFIGHEHQDFADLVDLNTQDVDSSGFRQLVITGTQGGTGYAFYNWCTLVNVVALRGVLHHCMLNGTIALATAGVDNIDFHKCCARQGAATITVNDPDLVNFFDFEGTLILQTMIGGVVNIYSSVGTRVTILASCTAGTINIYGDAVIDNQAAGTAVHDFTINKHVQQLVEGHKSLYESWQDPFIDDTIWVVADPATGAPWARGVAGAFILCESGPLANETARLRGLHHWVHNWMATPVNLLLKRLCIEWEMTLGVHTNVDNAISFFGWMPIAAGLRTTDDIIGFALIGDALQTVTDSGGAETVNTGFGETMASHNKFKIVIQEGEVRFYLNEQLIATHNTNVPNDPVLPNFYLDTEGTGGCAFVFGVIRIWQETIERY